MTDTLFLDAVVTATFLLAGLVKGVIGLGLPTVAVGLLSLVMTPAQAAATLVVPSLVTNLWQLAAGPGLRPLIARLWTMMLGIAVGTWAGSGLLTGDGAGLAARALGAALLLYAATGLTSRRLAVPRRLEPWLSPAVGVATGLVTGATGVFVIPAVPYLQAMGMERDALVQALGLSFTVSTLALAGALYGNGALPWSTAAASALAVLPALAGMGAGQWLRGRISAHLFRLCFLWGLLALGGHLLLAGGGR
ncbi:sulfite exporter TauE/SafE family protein [Azospirillum sp. RWY-5-1]|uniref:Probable membrane transporter protein n=1 Tax=Azospirillum oleiclasticum TaxID=2735135 RepID=A0ABX2TJN0_9PROT|nr:sulfite exporter TauE/SafE family protein [Azospirillum oleiclasticum]NYZ17099.1 sulfite exporter TauE/SafE family protein [Azospirillum oleiclasticum]NYZ24237.1 sulfite exporter TauE/SafE family protein [Azospirillum oleiclasticum]